MVWFSDVQDVFQKVPNFPASLAQKQADIEATKADAAARKQVEGNSDSQPAQPESKDAFRSSDPSTQLRQIVK